MLMLHSNNNVACELDNIDLTDKQKHNFYESHKLEPLKIADTIVHIPKSIIKNEYIDHNKHSAIIISQPSENIQKIAVLKVTSKITHKFLDRIFQLTFNKNSLHSLNCYQLIKFSELFGDIDTKKNTKVTQGYMQKEQTLTIRGISLFEKPLIVTRHFYKLNDSYYILDIYSKTTLF